MFRSVPLLYHHCSVPLEFQQFIDGIIASRILTKDAIDAVIAELPAEKQTQNVEVLGNELISRGLLTRYQIGRILQGRHHGLVLGNLILKEKIGQGGMGRVYLAEHKRMKRPVAVKIMNENAMKSKQSVARFMLEVQTAAQLTHNNIVAAYDADEFDGVPYLVMEYVEGRDLRSIVKESGPITFKTAIMYIKQVAAGLHFAHEKGVVHRDIKPSNILATRDHVAKILDMGLARNRELADQNSDSDLHDLTKEHHVIGTAEFMSPEQADDSKSVDRRTDIYSLGCSLFYIVAGKAPFHRSTAVQTLLAHRTDPIPSLRTSRPDISADADRVYSKMVAKHPDDRYQSAKEVVAALNRLSDDDFLLTTEPDEGDDTRSFENVEIYEQTSEHFTSSNNPDEDQSTEVRKIKEHAIGIDLGTTFSAISYLNDLGRPVTIVNAEGDKITPSVVLFDDEDVIVGKEAVKAMATDMPMIAECAKRDLGRNTFHKRFAGRKYRPEILLAYILRKLKTDAEEQIGSVRRAVVTVPAYFDEIRRKATQDAGYIAGLEVMDIINEPTSAAVAYGYQQSILQSQSDQSREFFDRTQRILVYDLGGGTFDVTVMEIRGSRYKTLATDGDVQLGGRDWDERVVEFVSRKFFEEHGEDPRLDANSLGRLLREVEDAKRTLSSRNKATIAIEYGGKASRYSLSRELFEELNSDLLARTEFTTRQTLKASGLTWKEIDRVLLVGGSTRMTAVSKMLTELSGIQPDRSVAPDEAVAHGAAIHAGMLLLKQQGEKVRMKITNVNSHSLGVVGSNPKTGQLQTGFLIPRNTPLPTAAKRVFRTQKAGQNSIRVQIVEGESEHPDECSQVGKCIVHNLPKNLPAKTPITVIFQYDENGRLTVTVQVTGIELKQQIMRENSMRQEELEYWRQVVCQ